MLSQNLNDAPRGVSPARRLPAYLLGLALAFLHTAAMAADADIRVVSVNGDVRITAAGAEYAAKAGNTLELPATVRTGRDSSTDLRQGDTTIGIGAGTELNFPAPAMPDAPVDRIVQPLGNAFYNVGPRGNRRLRVETPFLVAVIKGTQFNVAVAPDSGTISLYEGSLEVLAPDIGARVLLNAGEIAIRHRGDDAIRVIPMRERGMPAATSKDPDGSGSGADESDGPVILGNDAGKGTGGSGPITPIDPVEGKAMFETQVDAGGLAGAQVGLDIGVDAGSGTVDASLTAGVDAGAIAVDASVDAGVDLGAGTIDAAVDASVDAGVVAVDASVDAGVDLGAGTVDAAVDLGVDAGPVSVDAGVDAGVDLGAGTVDAGVDLGVDTGIVDADVGVDAGVDLGAGTVDAGVDLGVDTGIVDTDVGVDLGVDASSGSIDVGLDVLDTGIDIGLGGDSLIDIDVGTTPENEDTGGLLNGILRRIRL